ncbi:MAG: proline--tRNA ligase [Coriobacteriales bacterium]|jgi:prolyl-tRNA synthetase|nr:proline--tRNA ligase [Coriobacteriales bacterium]
MSKLYAPTLKEDPGDADIASHKLLLRAAMMRKVAAGVYSFLPLGFKVLRKVEQIVREEMDAIGCQEMIMSIIQPGELWKRSGRWDDYGPELFRLNDRHDNVFALSPTQEELITDMISGELRSYRDLPKSLYHIQWKYRDEVRPRFGLLRGREFVMKDAYSFHDTRESLQEHYDQQGYAYGRICERLGLRFVPVEADSGQIGGKVTVEFMALADAGEAEIVHCDCGFAANTEVAIAKINCELYGTPDATINEIETPIDGSIPALAEFLGISQAACVKALAGKDADGQVYVLFIPGDHELGDVKVSKIINGFELLDEQEMADMGLKLGFIGPVGLPRNIKVVADQALQNLPRWLTGANKAGYHLSGVAPEKDFQVDIWADLANTQDKDCCIECGRPLILQRGIEVGQIFQLGTKYSESMGAYYMAEDGNEYPFLMGCYGWGVTRSIAAVVEQYNDEAGIAWPISIAPAEVCVIPLALGDELETTARQITDQLAAAGIEVVIDDRDERPGVKFADADLIGWPYQVVVGKRGLADGVVELKKRQGQIKSELALDSAVTELINLIKADRAQYL